MSKHVCQDGCGLDRPTKPATCPQCGYLRPAGVLRVLPSGQITCWPQRTGKEGVTNVATTVG
ncbi:MAG: hypothetical protein AB7R89_16285 [Dehalococcoidia bacterium]